jgi:hypothetical protein
MGIARIMRAARGASRGPRRVLRCERASRISYQRGRDGLERRVVGGLERLLLLVVEGRKRGFVCEGLSR